MADQFPVVKLPAGLKLPGIYTQVILNSDGGAAAPNSRVLLWAYVSASAPVTRGVPFQALNLAQVVSLCGADSMARMIYEAAKSQLPQGIGAEFHIVPLDAPSSGTAAAAKVQFVGAPAAGVTSTATAAAAADSCTVTWAGRGVTFGVLAGDTWAQIATKAKAAFDLVTGLHYTVGLSGDTLTLTLKHKGAVDWGAVQIDFQNATASGCAASPGTLAYSGTAGASGTATYNLGVATITQTITSGDLATVSATGAVAKIRSDSYCVDAAQPGTPDGSVVLYYISGRPCRAISASLATVTTQTLTVSCDTAGVGTPTITAALIKLAADENAYKCWVPFFTDATNQSALVSHIEAQESVGTFEKGQMSFVCITGSLTALSAANLPEATNPKMSTSARYPVLWEQGSPQCGFELAARVAAEVASTEYQAQNFNGLRLKTNESVPLGVPHKADRASREDLNTAIATYRHAPIAVDSGGYNAVVRSNSSYLAQGVQDKALEKWSCRITLDFFRADLRAFLSVRFGDKSLKRYGTPRTTRVVKLPGLRTAVYECVLRWDDLDLFDGAESVRDAILAGVQVSPNRIDIAAPFRTVKDIDQIVVAGIQQ